MSAFGEFAAPALAREAAPGGAPELEEERRRAEGLAALGRMVAGFAHEVRNPLAAIRALSEALLAEVPAGDPRRDYAELLSEMVRRLETLVRSSLRFGLPEPPCPQPVDATRLVSAALDLLAPRFGARGGRPAVEAPPSLPPAFVDEGQIVEVLVILLENALDAAGESARVRVRLDVVRDADLAAPAAVRVDVRDEGAGIPAESLERIFEPFFTTKPRGLGLGLAIAQRLVREANGHLLVASAPGAGTTFTLLLPEAGA